METAIDNSTRSTNSTSCRFCKCRTYLRLEPDAGKLARPVLRGLRVSNGSRLPDKKARPEVADGAKPPEPSAPRAEAPDARPPDPNAPEPKTRDASAPTPAYPELSLKGRGASRTS